jgi:hypothetical protein
MAPETTSPSPRTTRANRERRWAGHRPPETAETIADQCLAAVRFAQSLLHLSRPRIELHAVWLETRRASPDDDLAWWAATMALDRALRRRGTGHEAAMAARLASQAVLAAATRTGLASGPDVNAVARSAGEVARALAAGDLSTAGADYLARGWEDLISPAGPPSPSGPAGGRGPGKRR